MRRISKIVMFVVLAAFVGLIAFQWGADITSRFTDGSRLPKGIIGKVDKTDIKATEYQNLLHQALTGQEQAQRRTPLTENQVDSLHDAVWQDLVMDKIWGNFISREGISVSDAEVMEILKSNPPPELRNRDELKTNGQYDPAKYIALLGEPQLQPFFEAYAQQLKKIMPREKVRWDIVSSYRVTSSELHDLLGREGVEMKATALLVGPKALPAMSKPTDAEAQAYYEKNKKIFEKPEERFLKMVIFPKLASSADSVSARERVDDAVFALSKGDDIVQVAKDYSDQPAESIKVTLAVWPEQSRKILAALKTGEVSAPFLDGAGWHIVKSLGLKSDTLRMLMITVRVQASSETVEGIKERIDAFTAQAKKAKSDTVKFNAIAKEYGLPVREMAPARDGKLYIQGMVDPTPIETFIQRSKPGSISPPFKTLIGYAVFYYYRIEPQEVRPFDKLRDAIAMRWGREKQQEQMKKVAGEVFTQARNGMSLEQIAAANPRVVRDTFAYRNFSHCRGSRGSRFAGALYALRQNETSGPVETEWGHYIIRCDRRTDGEWKGDVQGWEKEYHQGIIKLISENLFPTPTVRDYRDAFFY